MDDLLALMGDADDTNDDATNEIAGMAETETDMEKLFGSSTSSICSATSSTGRSDRLSKNGARSSSSSSTSAGSVDPLTKIRIVSRQTSKCELVDKFAPFQFHTTAALANMSNSQKSSFITVPSNKTNGNDVAGKTNMATMGIVMENPSARTSKNGRGFGIFTLGDLNTGPTVSVFLFGHAHSKFATKIKRGAVIAVIGSTLMPPSSKSNGKTRISLSVNDEQQVICVGRAMDYAVCTGKYFRNKQDMPVRCSQYLDTRMGTLCQYHQRQQTLNSGAKKRKVAPGAGASASNRSGVGANKNMTFMQSLKHDRSLKQQSRGGGFSSSTLPTTGLQNQSNMMTMVMPGQGTVVTHNPNMSMTQNQFQTPSASGRGGLGGSHLDLNLGLDLGPTMANRTVVSHQQNLQRAPKHMKVTTMGSSANTLVKSTSSAGVRNPYARTVATPPVNNNNRVLAQGRVGTNTNRDVLGQALRPIGSSSASNTQRSTSLHNNATKNPIERKKQSIIKHMKGFDGSVSVPKPNVLFRKTAPAMSSPFGTTSHSQAVTPSPQVNVDAMRERQRQLAQQLRQNQSSGNGISSHSKRLHKAASRLSSKKEKSKSTIDDLDLYGEMGERNENYRKNMAANNRLSIHENGKDGENSIFEVRVYACDIALKCYK